MPLSPPENRNAFALVVLFIIGVITVVDVVAINLLGSNANSTFQYFPTNVVPPAGPPVEPVQPQPPVDVIPPPRPVERAEVEVAPAPRPVSERSD